MQVRKRGETISFEDALDREDEYLSRELGRMREDPTYVSSTGLRRSYVARGRYAEQLERWLASFPRDQLLVLTSEELWADPEFAMRSVTRFLGVPGRRLAAYPRQSVGAHGPMTPQARERLARVFEPENRRLEVLLGRALDWTR